MSIKSANIALTTYTLLITVFNADYMEAAGSGQGPNEVRDHRQPDQW